MRRHLARWELEGVQGAVVVVDVIRVFTTAAYAFGSGAAEIYLVGTVDEALAFKAANPGSLAMGEDRGLRPDGFDFPNSPAMVRDADLAGRTLVQRTSAGTQGVVRAVDATRLWAASLVVASATAHPDLIAGRQRGADHQRICTELIAATGGGIRIHSTTRVVPVSKPASNGNAVRDPWI